MTWQNSAPVVVINLLLYLNLTSMVPNIEAFIICWNEEQIIRHTLNHYSSFCSKITLIDNHSTDNTPGIVKKYFPDVNIVNFDSNNEHRDDILLEIKNNCWKKSTANYVIVCDTDEFLFAKNMKSQLNLLCEHKVVLPLVIGYNMGSTEFPVNFEIPIYEQVKNGKRESGFDKQIIFSPHTVTEINFALGCHECSPMLKHEKSVDTIVEFKLLHYKYLGKDYLYKKHEAYASRLSLFNIRNNVGNHYFDREHIDRSFSLLDKHLYKVV